MENVTTIENNGTAFDKSLKRLCDALRKEQEQEAIIYASNDAAVVLYAYLKAHQEETKWYATTDACLCAFEDLFAALDHSPAHIQGRRYQSPKGYNTRKKEAWKHGKKRHDRATSEAKRYGFDISDDARYEIGHLRKGENAATKPYPEYKEWHKGSRTMAISLRRRLDKAHYTEPGEDEYVTIEDSIAITDWNVDHVVGRNKNINYIGFDRFSHADDLRMSAAAYFEEGDIESGCRMLNRALAAERYNR